MIGVKKRAIIVNMGFVDVVMFNPVLLSKDNEIRSAVLIIHGEKAHSCYFGKDAYAAMTAESKYTDNKELMIIPDAVHTDLYDNVDVIPFEKLQAFYEKYL